MYSRGLPAVVMKGIKGEKSANAAPIALVPGFVTASAKAGFVIHVQKLDKMVTELWAVNEVLAAARGNADGTPWHSSAEAPSSVLVPATAPRVRARATPSIESPGWRSFVTRRLPLCFVRLCAEQLYLVWPV